MSLVSSDAALGNRKAEIDEHIEVDRLPDRPEPGQLYWLTGNGASDFTHGLFKFPAKFHVPVIEWALDTVGNGESCVLDPFTGSGTVQVEAKRRGITSVGVDVDPLSVMISRTKTTPLAPEDLTAVVQDLNRELVSLRSNRGSIQDEAGADIGEIQYATELDEVVVPPIPNIDHWFRRYVIIDLARLKRLILSLGHPPRIERFLLACFAGVIRRVSNADPAPVSGLEVTSHQAEKNPRREISVFDAFQRKLEVELRQFTEFWNDLGPANRNTTSSVRQGDAASLSRLVSPPSGGFPLVITSPPYCRAVDYRRRHRLEHFWLDFVASADEHVELGHEYIGREYVRVGDWDPNTATGIPALDAQLETIRGTNRHYHRTVHHYFSHMERVLAELEKVMHRSGTLVLVLGDSVCGGHSLETADHILSLAQRRFNLDYRFRYEIRNHHMQYGLWNGQGIKEEHVLVLTKG